MKLTDEQIGAELHALRETPNERFAAELDQRVSAGFPETRESTVSSWGERLRPLLRPRMVPMYAASLLLVLVVSVAVIGSLSDEGGEQGGKPDQFLSGDGEPATPQSAESGRAGDAAVEELPKDSIEPASPGGGVVAPEPVPPVPPLPREQLKPGQERIQTREQLKPGQERIQERSASMSLSTEPGQVDDVADGVVEVTERYDGIVVSSNVSTSDARGRADFDLRIPTQNLQATLADLSDLADVSSRDEGSLDITAPFVTAEERFDDAKAEVDALLDQLAEADSASEIESIRGQLRLARGELAAARAELGALKQRADFSQLSVSVLGNGDGDGDWSIGDAADDAVNVLEALGGAALVTLAVVIPLGGLALLAWFATTRLRQRRRESALDE